MDLFNKCSLCADPETSKNSIISCTACDLSVHVLCYGIESISGNWKCSPCDAGVLGAVCKLCMQNGGALKKTTCGGWVHVLCGLFIDECTFVDKNVMEPVDITNVSDSKSGKTCMFCKSNGGFSPLCSRHKCNNRLHISCAHKNGCLKEDEDKDKKLKFRAYCFDHKPTGTTRRISSVFVRDAVIKKYKKKSEKDNKAKKISQEKNEKEKSSNMNTQWLIEKSLNANESSSSSKRMSDEQPTTNVSMAKQQKLCDSSNSLEWDSYDLNNFKQDSTKYLLDQIFEEENEENFIHACYKDEKMSKVSLISRNILTKLELLRLNVQSKWKN